MEKKHKKVDGIVCPFCNSTSFTGFDNSDYQATALFCDNCPAGMEDSGMTLAELISLWKNQAVVR